MPGRDLYQGFLEAQLEPCHALEIDCPDLFELAPRGTRFIKGFLVIQSPLELDVVAVYTAADKCCENVVSIHTERVPARQVSIPVCEDLDLTLNTGKADWIVVQSSVLLPADLDTPVDLIPGTPGDKPDPWLDIEEAEWVSHGPFKRNTTYRFKLCFCLCKGFLDARLSLDVRTDNTGEIFLNGSMIGATGSASFSQPPTHIEISDQSMFVAGENCLEVEVMNESGPTGFSLAGTMTAAKARCRDRK